MATPNPTPQTPALAKITRPALADILARERLFQRLDEARSRAVVWVSGPPGSGKTTLVSSYAAARGLHCLWYQIDAGDADLPTFFYYLGLAGQTASSQEAGGLPLLTAEYLDGIPEFSRNFFEDLFGRLGTPSLLVFDDCHTVSEDAALYRVFVEGFTRLPAGVNLLFASRSDPPSPFARLRANRQMEVIGWEDLRLTFDELAEIADLYGLATKSPGTLAQLHGKMDGWAAGLQLLLETTRAQSLDDWHFGDEAPAEIFDYFVGEVFDRLDKETQNFLLRTSVFSSLTPEMASQLTGHPRCGRVLSLLHQQNLFTEKKAGAQPVFQYHPLFREFLLECAREALPPEEVAEVERKAARLLMEAGRPEEAAELLQAAGDWNGLTGLIAERAPELLQQGRRQVLERWLQKLPEGIVQTDPWLLYWLGACRMPVDPLEARHHFEHALERFRQQEEREPRGVLLSWSGAVDSILYGLDDFAEADPWVELLSQIVGGPDRLDPGPVGDRVIASMYAALVLRRPTHPDFVRWEARALQLADRTADVNAAVQLLVYATFGKCYLGDVSGAELFLETMKRAAQSGEATPLSRLRCLFAEAFFCNTQGLFDRAVELVQEGLGLADASGVHVVDLMLLSNGVRAALNRGDPSAAGSLLERMATYPLKARRWNECFYHFLRAGLALHEGRSAAAMRSADMALELTESVGVCYAEAACHLLKAEVAHECDEEEVTAKHLAEAQRIARENGYAQLVLSCHLVGARVDFDRGADRDGRAHLDCAMTLGRESGRLVPYLYRPHDLAALCARALEAGIEAEYVRSLIRRCGLVPEAPPVEIEAWPWALQIYTLGRFELLRDGEPIRSTGKAQQRPLAMLKTVIAMGGRRVSEFRIADALWPDADGDLSHQSFATTLHRLRRLLGVKEAIELREGKLTLDARYCWVDAWAFERLLGQAEAARGEGERHADLDASTGFINKALELYKGVFLPQDTHEPWSSELRNRLRSKLERGVELHGKQLEEIGRWAEAAELYQRALEVDPVVEWFYRRLMLCLQKQDREAEALVVYRRCRKILDSLLGVEPSEETKEIARALKMD